MPHLFAGRCGTYCGECGHREKTNCPGCRTCGGKMFWGQCVLAACAVARGLDHCGECTEFPCERLKEYSFDPTHGDNGLRIRNAQAWNAHGFDSWLSHRC
jgi:hypothetical protein